MSPDFCPLSTEGNILPPFGQGSNQSYNLEKESIVVLTSKGNTVGLERE